MKNKILVLDDQNHIKPVIELLEILEYKVTHVYDIKSALEVYEDFDLIISDVNLRNNETGFDFYEIIKDKFSGKIFFHSGFDYHVKAKELGVPFYSKGTAHYETIVKEMLS